MGSLRRLAIAPIEFEEGDDIWESSASRKAQGWAIRRALLAGTIKLLSTKKGYDAIPVEIYEDMYPEMLRLSSEGMQADIDRLMEWARRSSDGEVPPADIASIVSNIGRPLNVDGLVIVQGFTRHPNVTSILTVLTASLSWPLIFLEGRSELRADIYEVYSGRIVWRSTVRNADSYGHPQIMLERLFDQLEPSAFQGLAND